MLLLCAVASTMNCGDVLLLHLVWDLRKLLIVGDMVKLVGPFPLVGLTKGLTWPPHEFPELETRRFIFLKMAAGPAHVRLLAVEDTGGAIFRHL